MDTLTSNMDEMTRHWAPEPRLLPPCLPLGTLGVLSRKIHRIQRTFTSFNFSFILRGRGDYLVDGVRHSVRGPVVLTQWPGAAMDYGPDAEGWDEVYLIYPASTWQLWQARGLWSRDQPWWPFARSSRFSEALKTVQVLSERTATAGDADWLDRQAELMVVASRAQGLEEEPEHSLDTRLRTIHDGLIHRLAEAVDFACEARQIGLSYSGFRRHWSRLFGLPPARTLAGMRLREARRLLAETGLPIHEVAERCGYPDALYFSRKFSAAMDQAPSRYRARNRF